MTSPISGARVAVGVPVLRVAGRLAGVVQDRVVAVERNLDRALEASPAAHERLSDDDVLAGSSLTAAAAVDLFADQVTSRALDVAARELKATGADTLVVANAPCQLEMIEGIQRAGLANRIRVRHIADVLAEALAPNAGQPETDRSREVNMRTK